MCCNRTCIVPYYFIQAHIFHNNYICGKKRLDIAHCEENSLTIYIKGFHINTKVTKYLK